MKYKVEQIEFLNKLRTKMELEGSVAENLAQEIVAMIVNNLYSINEMHQIIVVVQRKPYDLAIEKINAHLKVVSLKIISGRYKTDNITQPYIFNLEFINAGE